MSEQSGLYLGRSTRGRNRTIYLSPEAWVKLERLASEANLSISAYIEVVITSKENENSNS